MFERGPELWAPVFQAITLKRTSPPERELGSRFRKYAA
jgi:hypothetical protein